MSFVATATEDCKTVADAIAFIDSFDTDPDVLKTSSSTRGYRKVKSNQPGYTTRVQRSKTAELQALRRQVSELELHVKQLKRSSSTSSKEATLQSKWQKEALRECRHRQRSEEKNAAFKSVIAQHHKLGINLRRILGKKSLAQDKEFVAGPRVVDPRAEEATNTAIITRLDKEISRLYEESTLQMYVGISLSTSSSMRTKHEETRGEVVEVRSTTLLPCTMKVAAELLWENLTTDPALAPFVKGKQSNSNSNVKNWTMILEGETQVKTVQLLRKFEEPNRVVIMKAGVLTSLGNGPQFRVQRCVVITPSDDHTGSVVHAYEQMNADQEVTASKAMRDSTLQKLSLKLHEDSQLLQDRLIEQAERYNEL